MFALDGKVCVVTGALGLIGRELARALASRARVVSPNLDTAPASIVRMRRAGRASATAPISRAPSARVAARRHLESVRRLERLVNTRRSTTSSPRRRRRRVAFGALRDRRWRRMLDANVTVPCLPDAGQRIAARRTPPALGLIITSTRLYGVVAAGPGDVRDRRHQAFYKSPGVSDDQGPVLGFTRTRHVLGPRRRAGQRDLAGRVENGQDASFATIHRKTPLGRMATPRDYAAPPFLASAASAYMTGTNLVVDGGFTAW